MSGFLVLWALVAHYTYGTVLLLSKLSAEVLAVLLEHAADLVLRFVFGFLFGGKLFLALLPGLYRHLRALFWLTIWAAIHTLDALTTHLWRLTTMSAAERAHWSRIAAANASERRLTAQDVRANGPYGQRRLPPPRPVLSPLLPAAPPPPPPFPFAPPPPYREEDGFLHALRRHQRQQRAALALAALRRRTDPLGHALGVYDRDAAGGAGGVREVFA
ncbi:hypothetical protein SLS56_005952 [Neofusicoccum ribis]|uniref:Uncharacterized protein n=1 Tax=Neofusicoccum ribis TaxID=45134 RepID=A0ABR3SS12_9PEZI